MGTLFDYEVHKQECISVFSLCFSHLKKKATIF